MHTCNICTTSWRERCGHLSIFGAFFIIYMLNRGRWAGGSRKHRPGLPPLRHQLCPWIRTWNSAQEPAKELRYESSTIILFKELSSSIFQSLSVCPFVKHAWHLSKSPLCAIYKGIDALYWPSIINYQLLLPQSVLYWPSTQLHQLVTHSWANWI